MHPTAVLPLTFASKAPSANAPTAVLDPASTLASSTRTWGAAGVPNAGAWGGALVNRAGSPISPGYSAFMMTQFVPGQIQEYSFTQFESEIKPPLFGKTVRGVKRIGDFFTLKPMYIDDAARYKSDPESPSTLVLDQWTNENDTTGHLPFYFKDLRDDTVVVFRAYLEAITENVQPTWGEETYIGRSEPVYVYERTTRDLAFSLKLFAHTEKELGMIYKKVNRITSMCYPMYKPDVFFSQGNVGNEETTPTTTQGKIRMKPPLIKLRIGELFGSKGSELSGFIRSLNYSVPDNSPWETKANKRVPKHLLANFTFQVVHGDVPGLMEIIDSEGKGTGEAVEFPFYGFTGPKDTAMIAGEDDDW